MTILDKLSPPLLRLETPESAHIVATPAALADDVFVILDDMPGQPFGPIHGWRHAPEAGWPQAGGRCAVQTAPDGTAWFIGWDRP